MLSIYRLPNHIEGEKLIKIVRKDIFILLKKVALSAVLAVLPLAFFYAADSSFPEIMGSEIGYPLTILGASAYYLFVWLFFFFVFIDYYLDVWIITSERIIDVEQRGFFSRVISEQRLDKIQDVTSEVHGVAPTLLGYGDVFVQTAGARERFFFRQVPNPEQIRNTIIRLAEISRSRNA